MRLPLLCLLALLPALAYPGGMAVIDQPESIAPQQSRQYEFGNFPQQDTTVLLEITSRLHYRSLAGSTYPMKLTLNGRDVEAARSRSVCRLVNKPLVSPVAPNLPSSWYAAGVGWRVIYAPDFEIGRRAPYYVHDPYAIVLDVTDLVNPAAENRLEITNTVKRAENWAADEGHLILEKIVVDSKPQPSPTMMEVSPVQPVINRGTPAAGPASYQGEILPGGGFALKVDDQRWEFSSAFSYPNAGFNRLLPGESDPARQQPWEPRVATDGQGGEVLAEDPHYRLRRSVRFTPRRVEITDEITNKMEQPLGMLIGNHVNLRGAADPAVRLAGNADPTLNEYYSPANPSVHIALKDQSLGLICEDDVFRNQARLFVADDLSSAGLSTDMLRLAPGETYALRWAVYPVAGPDYFDFVNLVRQDWNSNFTVEGAWTFFHPDTILNTPVQTLRDNFSRLGIRYACYCGGWVDPTQDPKRIGFGTGVLDDYWTDFRRRLREAAARIREASPGVKVLVYYDSQRDTSEGGRERFEDSWLTALDGRPLFTEWGGAFSLTNSVVATLENSYGRAMLAAADRYMDELKIDGLYWDEMENVGYGEPLITYNKADGHSCLLDPQTYTLQREVGLTTLLGKSHRLAVIQRVRDKGGFVMGNGPATSLDMLRSGVPRMVEIQHNDYWCYESNLGTPLGYMSGRADFGNFVRALRLACLPVGTSYVYEHEISRFLFPFTPIELHSGYLLGEERIIAVHAGDFGWPGRRCLVEVNHFDAEGKLSGIDYPTVIGTEARTAIRPGEGEAVVLVRLPVTVQPSGGAVTVEQVRYGPDGLSLSVNSPQGATMHVADGILPVTPLKNYAATVGGKPCQLRIEDESLVVAVPAGENTVTIALTGSQTGA